MSISTIAAAPLSRIEGMERRPFIESFARLAEVVSGTRKDAQLSQDELARRAAVPAWFVAELEAGRPRAEVVDTMAVLDALDLAPRSMPSLPHWAFDETGAYRPDSGAALPEGETDELFK